MAQNYSIEIANVVKNFLDTDDWHYSFDDEDGIFSFNLKLGGKINKISYKLMVRDDSYTNYAICPFNGDTDDPEGMARLAEFFSRANYGLRNGNFELDFRDGEIRYKSYVDCEGQLPSTEVVKNSIYVIAAMFQHYAPGITAVLYTDMSAKEANDKCDQS